jgi:hypothetical protein
LENSTTIDGRRYKFLAGAAAVLWIVVYMFARFALKHVDMELWGRVLIALAPVLPFAWFLVCFIGIVRNMDELQRRVHLEALAIAFPLTVLLLMALGLLELVVPLSPADWSYRHVWALTPLFYFGGLAFAWRRYQ